MAPKDPIITTTTNNNNRDDDVKTHLAKRPASQPSKDPLHPLPDLPDDGQEVSVFRQVALSAGLLASDGGLVLMQLVMLPTLQTLGVPVTSVTLPGCLSGSMAVVGLPLLGCLSDRGSNPHGRKKPAVVFSALVFLAGFSLVISGCGLHTWLGTGVREAGGGQGNASVMAPTSVFPPSSTGHSYEGTAESSPLQLDSATAVLRAAQALHGSVQSEETAAEAAAAQDRASGPQGLTSPPEEEDSLQGPENKDPSLPDWVTDPLGLAIPLAGVLAILGFAFIDMGNDLNNSSQKSFVLGCTRPAQHVSLLVVGVQMSALGGCVAAILGVTDLASYLTRGTILDAVPGKSMLQCGIFICLTLLCVLTTLLSAPSPPHPHGKASLSDVTSPKHPSYGTIEEGPGRAHQRAASSSDLLTDSGALPVADDALRSSDHHCDSHSHRSSHESGSIAFSRLDLSVSDYHLASSCESCMSSDIVRLLESGSVHERRSRHPPRTENSATTEQESRRAKLFASNSIVYYAIEDHGSVSAERDSERGERDPEHAAELSPSCRRGSRWCSRSTRRLALICMSMFFMCGAWQSFNVCTTDYLGKIIYRGDPDADPDSQSYTAYQQGMRTGSSGVLLLNGVYVVVNFMQKKVLTVAGPKIECLVVCGLQVGSLIALLMTNNVMVYYVTSTAVGIFRSAMYTIPFMLANEICQEEARAGGGEGQANVGSTMALVTSMIPLSNILVSSMTGPLIFSTGNPASPLYYTIAATFIAGVVFVFT